MMDGVLYIIGAWREDDDDEERGGYVYMGYELCL